MRTMVGKTIWSTIPHPSMLHKVKFTLYQSFLAEVIIIIIFYFFSLYTSQQALATREIQVIQAREIEVMHLLFIAKGASYIAQHL